MKLIKMLQKILIYNEIKQKLNIEQVSNKKKDNNTASSSPFETPEEKFGLWNSFSQRK